MRMVAAGNHAFDRVKRREIGNLQNGHVHRRHRLRASRAQRLC